MSIPNIFEYNETTELNNSIFLDSFAQNNDEIIFQNNFENGNNFSISEDYSFDKPLINKTIPLIDKSTGDKTEIKNQKKKEKELNNTQQDNKMPPTQYLLGAIKDVIFSKSKIDNSIKQYFQYTDNLTNLEKKMSNETYFSLKKRNRDKEPEILKEQKKLGRKKKNDLTIGLHNRNSEDNLIKKIKGKIIYFLLIFVNLILNSSLGERKKKEYVKFMKNEQNYKNIEKEDLIKDLDYQKIVNETKKERNIEFLKMTLKDFLSLEISPKYKTLSPYSNRNIINEIIENEKENEIIMFVLKELTLGDYIDIFTYKKELSDFGHLEEEEYKQIMAKFTRVDDLLKEIAISSEDNNYFSIFTSLLYNYERWFFIKKERKRNNNNNEEE